MERRPRGKSQPRRPGGRESQVLLVDHGVRIADQRGVRRVIGARVVDDRARRVARPHLDPHAPAFGITGRQLVARAILDVHRDHAAVPERRRGNGERRRLPQHRGGSIGDTLLRRRVELARIESGEPEQRHRHPRVPARHVVKGEIRARGHVGEAVGIAALPDHLPLVTVLAGRHRPARLAAREVGRGDALRERAVAPLAERALDRHQPADAHGIRVLIERPGRVVTRADAGEDGIRHVVAGAAQIAAPVEVGREEGMRRGRRGIGAAAHGRIGIDHVLPVGIARRPMRGQQGAEDSLIGRRTHAGLVDRIDQAMAKRARDAVAIVRGDAAAVGRNAVTGEPAHRRVAANAQVAGCGRILLGHGEARVEQRIAPRLAHHRALPRARLGVRLVSAVTRETDRARNQRTRVERLGPRLDEVAQRGRHAATGDPHDHEPGVARVRGGVPGGVVGDDPHARAGSGSVVDEPSERPAVGQVAPQRHPRRSLLIVVEEIDPGHALIVARLPCDRRGLMRRQDLAAVGRDHLDHGRGHVVGRDHDGAAHVEEVVRPAEEGEHSGGVEPIGEDGVDVAQRMIPELAHVRIVRIGATGRGVGARLPLPHHRLSDLDVHRVDRRIGIVVGVEAEIAVRDEGVDGDVERALSTQRMRGIEVPHPARHVRLGHRVQGGRGDDRPRRGRGALRGSRRRAGSGPQGERRQRDSETDEDEGEAGSSRERSGREGS